MTKHFLPRFLLSAAALSLSLPASAQEKFEGGALALLTFYKSTGVQAGSTAGSVGFRPGPAGGAFLGQNLNERLGGELRYLLSYNTLKVNSGGATARFGGLSHAVTYDLLVHFPRPDRRLRPYLAFGGGLKVYQGTGTETPFQPLSNLALLTGISHTVPTVDFGGGVKFQGPGRMMYRVEFRDYITGVPKVFEASPGARLSGVFHQWVPAFGISWTF